MSVFSVPVTIGVNEEEIAKNIEKDVINQVTDRITEKVEKVIHATNYYGEVDRRDLSPLRFMVQNELRTVLAKHEDQIVKLAAEILADKLARTKAVKEAAASVVKETLK